MTQPDKLFSIEELEGTIAHLRKCGMGIGSTVDVYQQLLDTMRENERLRDALINVSEVLDGVYLEFGDEHGLRKAALEKSQAALKPSKTSGTE